MEILYLAHHGILGMKWGVRRYQNPDGSLTAEGQRRYYGKDLNSTYNNLRGKKNKDAREAYERKNDESGGTLARKEAERTIRKDLADDYSKMAQGGQAIKTGADQAKQYAAERAREKADLTGRVDKKNIIDSSKGMTEKELRDAITRMDLETRYADLVQRSNPSVEKGRISAEKVLGTIGAVAATAVSVMTVASIYQQLRANGRK